MYEKTSHEPTDVSDNFTQQIPICSLQFHMKKNLTDVSDNFIYTNTHMQFTISHAQTDVSDNCTQTPRWRSQLHKNKLTDVRDKFT
jgi:hypothetical protein